MSEDLRKQLGRISKIEIGIGGYQDAMLGVSIIIEGKGWGVSVPFIGDWCPGIIDPKPEAKWTEHDRTQKLAAAMRTIGELLRASKRKEVRELVDVPVEAIFDEDMRLQSWRVLEEVLA